MDVFNEIFFGLLVILCVIVLVEHFRVLALKAEVMAYQEQILTLKLDSEKQIANTKFAYESAQKQMRQVQDETQTILRTKVSSNCENSIKWLIQQAKDY